MHAEQEHRWHILIALESDVVACPNLQVNLPCKMHPISLGDMLGSGGSAPKKAADRVLLLGPKFTFVQKKLQRRSLSGAREPANFAAHNRRRSESDATSCHSPSCRPLRGLRV